MFCFSSTIWSSWTRLVSTELDSASPAEVCKRHNISWNKKMTFIHYTYYPHPLYCIPSRRVGEGVFYAHILDQPNSLWKTKKICFNYLKLYNELGHFKLISSVSVDLGVPPLQLAKRVNRIGWYEERRFSRVQFEPKKQDKNFTTVVNYLQKWRKKALFWGSHTKICWPPIVLNCCAIFCHFFGGFPQFHLNFPCKNDWYLY